MKRLLVLLLFIPLTTFSQNFVDGYDLYTYSSWISGYFNSTMQSVEDGYFDNVYVYTTHFRSDEYGEWFYTEQGELRDKIPYRQRVYILSSSSDTSFINRVYKIKDIRIISDENKNGFFAGHNLIEKLVKLNYSDLEEMCGCSTQIRKQYISTGDWYYYGSTNEKDCKGTFRGATYTTSQFKVYSNGVVSWERGWNDDGKQIWGSTKGPYYYIKEK